MQAVILCGGQGTRLRSRIGDVPKPMVEIGGLPLLEHQVALARRHGVTDLLLSVGYRADIIQNHFGDGSRFGVTIRYAVESTPLGTAGAVLASIDGLAERFFVIYGDVMLNVDLQRLWASHARSGAAATLFAHPNDHPHDSDLIDAEADGRIVRLMPYPRADQRDFANLVSAALYVLERDALGPWRALGRSDFVRDLFPKMLDAGLLLRAYRSPEYIKDAGTPARLDAVTADFESGRVAAGSLAVQAPAVFLDRDGTLNVEVNRVTRPDDLRLLPGAAAAVRRLNKSGMRTIVVSNQPVVARGDCTEAELRAIHDRLETLLGAAGAYVDAIYYCPHHPDKGFAGEREELKVLCTCRKPAPGMIQTAAADLNIDLRRSWMVGDSTVDVQTAANAGVRSMLVRTGHAGRDARHAIAPDAAADDLAAAVSAILAGALAPAATQAEQK